MSDYDEAIRSLQELIDDKPPEVYIALPLSNLRSMRKLPADTEVIIPAYIPGSWFWADDLLKCCRRLYQGELSTHGAKYWGRYSCPDCLSSHTCQVALPHGYSVRYCMDCGLQWQVYMAWCPACGGFLHGDSITVTCDKCQQEWDTSLAKSANESNDILIEEEL